MFDEYNFNKTADEKSFNGKSYYCQIDMFIHILDSEQSEEASCFTMVFIYLFFHPVYNISTRSSASIATYSSLFFRSIINWINMVL